MAYVISPILPAVAGLGSIVAFKNKTQHRKDPTEEFLRFGMKTVRADASICADNCFQML